MAGAAIDRFGAKWIVPIGAALVGFGALLFGTGSVAAANVGRFMQGAGGVFDGHADGTQVWNTHQVGRFPEHEEILKAIASAGGTS